MPLPEKCVDVLLNRTAAFLFCAFYSKERTAAQTQDQLRAPESIVIPSDCHTLPAKQGTFFFNTKESFRFILDGNDAFPLQEAGLKPNDALWWCHQQGSLDSWPLPSGSASQHSLQGLPSQNLRDGGRREGHEGLRPRHPHFSVLAPRISPDLTLPRHTLGPSPRGRL